MHSLILGDSVECGTDMDISTGYDMTWHDICLHYIDTLKRMNFKRCWHKEEHYLKIIMQLLKLLNIISGMRNFFEFSNRTYRAISAPPKYDSHSLFLYAYFLERCGDYVGAEVMNSIEVKVLKDTGILSAEFRSRSRQSSMFAAVWNVFVFDEFWKRSRAVLHEVITEH